MITGVLHTFSNKMFYVTQLHIVCPVLLKFVLLPVTGETNDLIVRRLRSRQMKNFHVALMISQVYIIDLPWLLFMSNRVVYDLQVTTQ